MTWPIVAVTAGLWLCGGVLGVLQAGGQRNTVKTVTTAACLEEVRSADEHDARDQGGEYRRFALARSIFFRNSGVAGVMVLGTLSFGLTAIVASIQNGALLGYRIAAAAKQAMGWKAIAWALVPHGVFELPALVWAGAIGLQGPGLFRRWINGLMTREDLRSMARPLCGVVLLLSVAAIVEATLSIPVARMIARGC